MVPEPSTAGKVLEWRTAGNIWCLFPMRVSMTRNGPDIYMIHSIDRAAHLRPWTLNGWFWLDRMQSSQEMRYRIVASTIEPVDRIRDRMPCKQEVSVKMMRSSYHLHTCFETYLTIFEIPDMFIQSLCSVTTSNLKLFIDKLLRQLAAILCFLISNTVCLFVC